MYFVFSGQFDQRYLQGCRKVVKHTSVPVPPPLLLAPISAAATARSDDEDAEFGRFCVNRRRRRKKRVLIHDQYDRYNNNRQFNYPGNNRKCIQTNCPRFVLFLCFDIIKP